MLIAPTEVRSMALCLSGGGLRATLFHLGMIRALRNSQLDGQNALERVTEIYSVSGGSILAAHMLLNWDRYTGDATAFAEVEREILSFAQRNVRDRVLRRAMLSAAPLFLWRTLTRRPISGRTFWLRREYTALFGKASIEDCLRSEGEGPKLHILTTSFRTGQLCSFSGDRFEIERKNDDVLATPCGHISLAFAVAASSAFPPMFPPLVVTDDLLANPFDDTFLNPILLSDGGVYDNLGIEKFRRNMAARRQQEPPFVGPNMLVISNASASFKASATKSYAGPLSRNVRASDILMHRVGDNAEETIHGITEVDDIVVRLSTTVDDGTLDVTVQQRLRMVRTDIDQFRPDLARLLVEHGERVTYHELAAKGWNVALAGPPKAPENLAALHRLTGKAANRYFWSLALDFRDWRPLLTLWLIGLLLVGGAGALGFSYLDAKREEAAAQRRTQELNARQADTLSRAQAALRKNEIDKAKEILFPALIDAQTSEDDPKMLESSVMAAPIPQPTADVRNQQNLYPQRVYIQFSDSFTREQIVALNQRLRARGWNVQSMSGERTLVAKNVNEVRYSGDNERAAQDLANALNASGMIRRNVETRANPIIGGNLDIWIAN